MEKRLNVMKTNLFQPWLLLKTKITYSYVLVLIKFARIHPVLNFVKVEGLAIMVNVNAKKAMEELLAILSAIKIVIIVVGLNQINVLNVCLII